MYLYNTYILTTIQLKLLMYCILKVEIAPSVTAFGSKLLCFPKNNYLKNCCTHHGILANNQTIFINLARLMLLQCGFLNGVCIAKYQFYTHLTFSAIWHLVSLPNNQGEKMGIVATGVTGSNLEHATHFISASTFKIILFKIKHYCVKHMNCKTNAQAIQKH